MEVKEEVINVIEKGIQRSLEEIRIRQRVEVETISADPILIGRQRITALTRAVSSGGIFDQTTVSLNESVIQRAEGGEPIDADQLLFAKVKRAIFDAFPTNDQTKIRSGDLSILIDVSGNQIASRVTR